MNEAALIENSTAVPADPTSRAVIAGPKIRELVMTAVLSDTALAICSSGTNSVTKPRRAGLSNAEMIPSTNVSA